MPALWRGPAGVGHPSFDRGAVPGTHQLRQAGAHSTVYVDRPLPAHLRPGRTLTERDHAELLELLARRDGHNRRLYQDIARLQAELDATSASRLYRAVRRMAMVRGWLKR